MVHGLGRARKGMMWVRKDMWGSMKSGKSMSKMDVHVFKRVLCKSYCVSWEECMGGCGGAAWVRESMHGYNAS